MELTDILTQSVREPMRGYIDPLASLSFAPSLQSYKAIRDSFRDKMDTVHTMSCLAVQDSFFRAKAHQGFVAADELKEISQNLISTIESSDSMSLEFFQFLQSVIFFSTLVFLRPFFLFSLPSLLTIFSPLCWPLF